MIGSFRKSKTNILAWALLSLLVVGLIGLYGTRSGGLVAQDIASVGDEKIDAQDFYNALNRQMQAFSQQTGQNLTMTQARAFGLDRSVLAGLISTAAINSEATTQGISAGDATVREQLMATPAFQGVDGKFDRGAYNFALDNAGLTPSQYDETIREGIARDLLRSGIAAGLEVPDAATRAILAYLGEERNFEWVGLERASLGDDMPEPSENDLRDYFTDNADLFMLPVTRRVTYVKLTPDTLLDRFAASEEALRTEYQARSDVYSKPEQRVLDRIVFSNIEEATAAKAEIDSGSKTFDAVATDRGLTVDDTDIGAVTPSVLDADARALVFGAEGPGVVGPVPTTLGPALYRINAIIAASETPFEDVRDLLNLEIAMPEALDFIAQASSEVEDLLAGGATLEDIADETDFVLETATLTEDTTESLASDPIFLKEAFDAGKDEERDIIGLSDGGVAALRVDDITDAHPPEFADTEAEIRTEWEATRVRQLLAERAEAIKDRVVAGESLSSTAETSLLRINIQTNVPRGGQVSGIPEGMVQAVFDLPEGGVAVVPTPDGAAVVRVTVIKALDAGASDQATAVATLVGRQTAETQSDIFTYFAEAVQNRDGVSVNQTLLEQVLSQFP